MNRRSTAPLTLLELTVMLLVFALCAAVCLQLFVHARQTARQSLALTTAVSWSQTAADSYKAAGGEMEETARLLQTTLGEDGRLVLQTKEPALTLTLYPEGTLARIVVSDGTGKTVYSLTAKAVAYG